MRIADSWVQPGGGVVCPGLGWQGSKPVAVISVAPPHANPEAQFGVACQLSLSAITVGPEKSRRNGLASVPGTLKGGPPIEGPRPRTRTVLGALPPMMKPPIMMLSPVRAKPRVEMLVNRVPVGGGIGQTPPPSAQVFGEIKSDQQLSVPMSGTAESVIRNFQVPLTAEPDFPISVDRAPSGRNVPTKGGNPEVIGVDAASSKVVRLVSRVQAVP